MPSHCAQTEMIVTLDFARRKFGEFNRKMFGGHLPVPTIELSSGAGFVGKCCYHSQTGRDGLRIYYDFTLRFSTRFNLPQSEIEDTIIHEMIHYFILWSGLHDDSSHGNIFRALMASINNTHGRKVSISHDSTDEASRPAADTRRKWHVIAAIYFKDGRTGLKVLPRTMHRIVSYYKALIDHSEVSEIRLYLHDNPFFNTYPTSAALRYHSIDRTHLDQNLEGARPLRVEGNAVIS